MLARYVSLLVFALTLVGGCTKQPPEGSRFSVVEEAEAFRDLPTFDAAYGPTEHGGGGRRHDQTPAMMARGDLFLIPIGTTGEIIAYPRPNFMSNRRWWADVRFDSPPEGAPEVAIMNLLGTIKVIDEEE